MSSIVQADSERIYYLDWLRVFAVLAVFMLHCGLVFDSTSDWFIKNETTHLGFSVTTGSIYFWIMPLFFFVSGASTQRFLTNKTVTHFIKTRVVRLLIPFVIGVIVIIPPQAYIRDISHLQFEGSYFEFYGPYFKNILDNFEPKYNPTVYYDISGHLWFLITLFFISLICLPITRFIDKSNNKFRIHWLALEFEKRYRLFIFALPLCFAMILLKPIFPEYTGWADFFYWTTFYIYGYIFISEKQFIISINKHRIFLFTMAIVNLIGVYVALGICNDKDCFGSPDYSLISIVHLLFSSLTAWFFVLGFTSLFNYKFKMGGLVLNYCTKASFPFYFFHQTIIIVVAYYLLRLNFNIFNKFVLLALSSVLAILFLYNITRKIYSSNNK